MYAMIRFQISLIVFLVIGIVIVSILPSSFASNDIPVWIKNNADWWADGIISDKDFAAGLGYMVKEGIIKVDNVEFDSEGSVAISDDIEIPSWIQSNARWWADGLISDDDFKLGIAFMIEEKIIDFTEKRAVESPSLEPQSITKNEYFYAEQIFDDCKDDKHCVVESLDTIAESEQKDIVLGTFSELIVLYDEDPDIPCHEMAHHLGIWLYGYTQELEEALQHANPVCIGGNYHGIFQNYFAYKVLKGSEPNDIKIVDLCSSIDGNSYTLNKALCIHGIGHGLEVLYKYDTIQAVQRCDEIKTTLAQKNCFNGVFMENLLYFQLDEGDFDENDPHYPCNKVESRHSNSCYVWQAPPLLVKNALNVSNTFNECDKIPSEEGIKHCYFGIGRQLFNMQVKNLLSLCESGERIEYHVYCIRGTVMTSSTKYLETGFTICNILPEKYKHECYDGLGFWIQLRSADENQRKEFCSKAEKEYFDVCMNPDMTGISQV